MSAAIGSCQRTLKGGRGVGRGGGGGWDRFRHCGATKYKQRGGEQWDVGRIFLSYIFRAVFFLGRGGDGMRGKLWSILIKREAKKKKAKWSGAVKCWHFCVRFYFCFAPPFSFFVLLFSSFFFFFSPFLLFFFFSFRFCSNAILPFCRKRTRKEVI